jgi:hypothetical protein
MKRNIMNRIQRRNLGDNKFPLKPRNETGLTTPAKHKYTGSSEGSPLLSSRPLLPSGASTKSFG